MRVVTPGLAARHDASQAKTRSTLSNRGFDFGQVLALAVSDIDVFVGGNFPETGDGALADLGRIAHNSTATNTRHALPHRDLSTLVYALAVSGGGLYFGDGFATTGDGMESGLGGIARFDAPSASGACVFLPLVVRE